MDTSFSLLVFSTLLQLVVPWVSVTSFKAVVEMVSGDSRIFSGESVKLKCSIPDVHKSTWGYLWFRGSERLPQTEEHLTLWNAHIKQSGKFYCQGVRDTLVGKIHTLQSVPVQITVDGGWAILQVSPHPSLVGNTLEFTCRVRGTPKLHEVILYKDGVKVMWGISPHLNLTNATVEDQGMYSCRASWDKNMRTHSVMSVETPVQVLEILSQPVLEIDAQDELTAVNMMKLICHHQYNAPAPVDYYFYMDNNRLGTATSENHCLVKRIPGQYSCKARVPELGLLRWSEPKGFGQVAGPQMMMPSISQPTDPWHLAPPLPSPYFPKESGDKPGESGDMSGESGDMSGVSGDMSGESGDMSGVSGDMSGESGDMSGVSGDMSGESGDMSGVSGDMSGESGDMSGVSGDMPEESGDMPEESGDMSGESGDMPEESGDMPEESGDMYGESGYMPEEFGEWLVEFGGMSGESGDKPGESGDMSGESGDMPGESGDMSGVSGGMSEEFGEWLVEFGDKPGESGDKPGESGDMSGESGDMSGESGDMSGESGDMSGGSGDMSGGSGDMSGESGDMSGVSGDMSGESGDKPGESGDMSGESGDMSEESGDMPEESGDMPEESGDMSGESGDMSEEFDEWLVEFGDMSEEFDEWLEEWYA